MEPSCVFDYLQPGGVDCSDNGICVNASRGGPNFCVCDDGWLGVGDFILSSEDCVRMLNHNNVDT